VTNLEDNGTVNLDDLQKKKKQVWLIIVIMVITGCIGAAILFTILWFLFNKIGI